MKTREQKEGRNSMENWWKNLGKMGLFLKAEEAKSRNKRDFGRFQIGRWKEHCCILFAWFHSFGKAWLLFVEFSDAVAIVVVVAVTVVPSMCQLVSSTWADVCFFFRSLLFSHSSKSEESWSQPFVVFLYNFWNKFVFEGKKGRKI